MVLELKVELQRAKEAAQAEKDAIEASRQASYLIGVEETQIRLAEDLAEVCKDYCKVTWEESLNLVGVPIDSEWRQPGSVYYHPEIREVLAAIPFPSALAPEYSGQPLTTQATLPLPEVSKRSSQAGDQGQVAEVAKDKGKGKEIKPPSEAKDAAKAKEVAVKAKETEAKTKEVDPKAKDAPVS